MALEPQNRQPPAVVIPQHFVPPSLRELRGQAAQRLQLGLFGVAAMLLIVGLANIIMDRALLGEDTRSPAETVIGAPAEDRPASDPFVDIGVVPAPVPSAQAEAARPRSGSADSR